MVRSRAGPFGLKGFYQTLSSCAGDLPEEWSELQGLREVDISLNLYLDSELPVSWANLKNLENLYLGGMKLRGIDTFLHQLDACQPHLHVVCLPCCTTVCVAFVCLLRTTLCNSLSFACAPRHLSIILRLNLSTAIPQVEHDQVSVPRCATLSVWFVPLGICLSSLDLIFSTVKPQVEHDQVYHQFVPTFLEM
jgi:hypothetical protein